MAHTVMPSSQELPRVTSEDLKRARDRLRVAQARRHRWGKLSLLWLLIGPGVLVMLGENDAPSMLSYAATGATYGPGFFLPFILVTFLMAFIVQEMTVRLAAATHRGHAELIFERFGPFWGAFALVDLALGNLMTLVTEFIGIRAGLGFFGVPPVLAVLLALAVIALVVLTRRYWTWERIGLALATFNLVFIPVAVLAHPDPGQLLAAFLTWQPVPRWDQTTLLLLLADIGATVTPWMLFFQQSASVDKGVTGQDIAHGRLDTALGALLAAVAGIATAIATSPLFAHHVNASSFAGADFARALLPYVGRVGASLFALGIVEAGLLAAITIASSSAYAFGEVTRQPHSLNRSWREGWPFYCVLLVAAGLAAAVVLIPNAPLEFIVLIVNVYAVLSMPPALVFLTVLVNDREIMGEQANGSLANVLTVTVTLLICLAGLVYGIATVFPGLLPS
ncbi:hypothetical protein KTAU_31650 [Thermogemmatispora aurantia]|jgi:Mn2+/Fe2+ NRAMP family transporter|uniref:NRAMP family divalent metal transporter n=1 Tax=Thermogemmatispora aurantia TaxID=2045279 RepID=UPI00127B1EE0|nr:divalent metal cation transporter [Thermogemmatispora aurantia]GER84529.1 hypothetical protein KTAU_31650 [Thermogemmatispora aurantia]